jgi:hypothetical protein
MARFSGLGGPRVRRALYHYRGGRGAEPHNVMRIIVPLRKSDSAMLSRLGPAIERNTHARA